MACREIGRSITTFKILYEKITIAKESFKQTGLDDVITLIQSVRIKAQAERINALAGTPKLMSQISISIFLNHSHPFQISTANTPRKAIILQK